MRERNTEDAVVHQSIDETVGDARPRQDHRPLGAKARCRRFIVDRLNSSAAYARFAAAAGADILLDGEPLAGFKTVNRLDETALRHRDLELRRDIFAHMVSGPQSPKKLTG